MFGILQRYVARELFKTFALAAIGLTVTFSLCGGVLNMLQADALTTTQVLRVMGFILPVASTLTLPVAAMFACAMVYGRLAMDNEFDACKASGINIHRLLAPAVLLSLFTGLFTFAFSNYIIPQFVRGLDEMVQQDIHKLLIQALSNKGYIRRGPYILYAGNAARVRPDAESKSLIVRQAAFLEVENENLSRCGTADEVHVNFTSHAKTGRPVVEAQMFEVRALDVYRNQFYELSEQPFDPMEITTGSIIMRPKWLDLNQLLHYKDRPAELASAREKLQNLRYRIAEAAYYREIYRQITGPKQLVNIGDKNRNYEIRAQSVDWSEADYQLTFHNVTVVETKPGYRRTYRAERMTLGVKRGFAGGPDSVHIVLEKNVRFSDEKEPEKTVERRRADLEDVILPAGFRESMERFTDADLVGTDLLAGRELPSLELGYKLDDARFRVIADLTKLHLEIIGIIHSRLAFSISVFVLLILAAALGIIFRGGQLLTAFVISFMPGLFVVVMNIMGRQLTENTGTHWIGITVIWLAIVGVALADVLVLTRFLRR